MAISQQQRDTIITELATGASLRSACITADVASPAKVLKLASEDAQFGEHYAHAREAGYKLLADKLLEVADDDSIEPNSRRIMVDTRKWMLSKMLPKLYGDKLDLSGTLTAQVTLQVTQQDEKL